jgi:ClpP class serine protease
LLLARCLLDTKLFGHTAAVMGSPQQAVAAGIVDEIVSRRPAPAAASTEKKDVDVEEEGRTKA